MEMERENDVKSTVASINRKPKTDVREGGGGRKGGRHRHREEKEVVGGGVSRRKLI